MNFKGQALAIRDQDIVTAAGYLGCEVAVIRAIMAVEAGGRAFGSDGRPIILNEPHIFYRQLGAGPKRDLAVREGLAYKRWRTRPYPRTQQARYEWLRKAMLIDEAAALKSCSWGAGQVMGFNHKMCGFDTVQEFVRSMCHSVGAQLFAVVRYIYAAGLAKAARRKDWRALAKGYNGSGQVTKYSRLLSNAYRNRPASERHIPPAATERDIAVMRGTIAAEDYQRYKGYEPLVVKDEPLPKPKSQDTKKPAGLVQALIRAITSLFRRS